jgi:chitinase
MNMTTNFGRALRVLSIAALASACSGTSGDDGSIANPGGGDAPPGSDAGGVQLPASDGGVSSNGDSGAAAHDGGSVTQDGGAMPNDAGKPSGDAAAEAGPPQAGNFPARFAAPYVETWNDNDLAALANSTGHKFYTLAFIINGSGTCNPTWNGDTALGGNKYGAYIDALRKVGGDAIVSFGGASGTEMGQACGDTASLQAAYQKVITQFKLTWIDLDIESGAESDTPSIDRRNKTLKALQGANPDLRVSYTLGVDRTGLPSAQLNLLKNAQQNGARVDVVNIMAMDYGPCYTDMGQAAIDAAAATEKQLASIGLAAKVGITPMAGKNDTACEVFSTSDAQLVATSAQGNAYVRLLAFWAIGADPQHTYLSAFHPFH